MSKGYLSPGVGYTEKEILPVSLGPDTLAVGIVGGATKGPLELTAISSRPQLYEVFGYPTEGDYGLYAAEDVLTTSNKVFYKRVVGTGAAKGVAGDPLNDIFVFETKTLDSTQNGNIVSVVLDTEGVVTVTLSTASGEVIESLTGFSIDEASDVYLAEVYNNYSKHLNVLRTEVELPLDENEDPIPYEGATLTIRDGNDGIATLEATDIVGTNNTGLKAFYNADNVEVSTLIVPGWSDDDVLTELNLLTRYRGDVQVIPDPPQGLTPTQVKDWADATGVYLEGVRLDNEFFSVYYPWVGRRDLRSKKNIMLPPSGFVAAQWAFNDATAGPWFAPAGISENRGVLKNANSLEYELSKEERDFLYGGTGVINPIIEFRGQGIVLFGNKTTLRNSPFGPDSAKSYTNVRRLCNYIKKLVINISLTELFNPNDRFTWNSWKLKIEPRLREIQEGRGIEHYRIIMDETTVTQEDINAGRMPATIYVKPIRAAEYIPITFVVTSDDVLFETE